jgi:hypothetical protein
MTTVGTNRLFEPAPMPMLLFTTGWLAMIYKMRRSAWLTCCSHTPFPSGFAKLCFMCNSNWPILHASSYFSPLEARQNFCFQHTSLASLPHKHEVISKSHNVRGLYNRGFHIFAGPTPTFLLFLPDTSLAALLSGPLVNEAHIKKNLVGMNAHTNT